MYVVHRCLYEKLRILEESYQNIPQGIIPCMGIFRSGTKCQQCTTWSYTTGKLNSLLELLGIPSRFPVWTVRDNHFASINSISSVVHFITQIYLVKPGLIGFFLTHRKSFSLQVPYHPSYKRILQY